MKIKKLGNILFGIVFAFLMLVAVIVAISGLKIPGNYKIFSVQSGSMEPSIKVGSIVIVKPFDNYQKGDVITVADPSNPKNTLTHRIYDVKDSFFQTLYITKGDANNAPDSEARLKENVLGKVIFSVPFIGYPIGFAKTRDGLLLLIIIPATIIIYGEALTIKNEVQNLIKERKSRKLSFMEIKKLLVALLILGIPAIGLTKAFLSDRESSSVSLTAGTWDDPTPSGSSDPSVETGVSLTSFDIAAEETATPEATVSPSPTETPTVSPEATPEPETPTPTPNEAF
jgi:signal peptidase